MVLEGKLQNIREWKDFSFLRDETMSAYVSQLAKVTSGDKRKFQPAVCDLVCTNVNTTGTMANKKEISPNNKDLQKLKGTRETWAVGVTRSSLGTVFTEKPAFFPEKTNCKISIKWVKCDIYSRHSTWHDVPVFYFCLLLPKQNSLYFYHFHWTWKLLYSKGEHSFFKKSKRTWHAPQETFYCLREKVFRKWIENSRSFMSPGKYGFCFRHVFRLTSEVIAFYCHVRDKTILNNQSSLVTEQSTKFHPIRITMT